MGPAEYLAALPKTIRIGYEPVSSLNITDRTCLLKLQNLAEFLVDSLEENIRYQMHLRSLECQQTS